MLKAGCVLIIIFAVVAGFVLPVLAMHTENANFQQLKSDMENYRKQAQEMYQAVKEREQQQLAQQKQAVGQQQVFKHNKHLDNKSLANKTKPYNPAKDIAMGAISLAAAFILYIILLKLKKAK